MKDIIRLEEMIKEGSYSNNELLNQLSEVVCVINDKENDNLNLKHVLEDRDIIIMKLKAKIEIYESMIRGIVDDM